MDKLIVFSCIAGGFDPLVHIGQSQPIHEQGVRYILFTDKAVTGARHGIWELWPFAWTHPNARRTARFHKVMAHRVLPWHDASCWLDGALQIKSGISMLSLAEEALADHDLASFKHPERQCIYQEHKACLKLKKDDPEVMRLQVERYRAEGYPAYQGLVESACVFRRNVQAIREFNEAWWREIEQGSLRDQLSFNYVAHKLQLPYGHIQGRRDESPYFTFRSHKRR